MFKVKSTHMYSLYTPSSSLWEKEIEILNFLIEYSVKIIFLITFVKLKISKLQNNNLTGTTIRSS